MENLLSTPQAARYLGVSLLTLRRDLAAGHLKPDVIVNPRCFLYTKQTLDAWKKKARVPVGRPRTRAQKAAAA